MLEQTLQTMMAKQVIKGWLIMIICIIYNIICPLSFNKHATWPRHKCLMFISWKRIWYLCNMNFLWHNKTWCFFLLWCSLQSGYVLMLHKKVLFTTLCDIVSFALFFDVQKRWRLGKKFCDTNFCFFTPFAVHDF